MKIPSSACAVVCLVLSGVGAYTGGWPAVTAFGLGRTPSQATQGVSAQGLVRAGVDGRDVFAFVRVMDEVAARRVWPGFRPSDWPVAVFDGSQTILLRHASPPPEFTPMPGHAGVLAMRGRHPAVVANSTREIGGVRTATVIATPTQPIDSTMLAYVEEVFHVYWLRRHVNFRPDEMARYAYPVKDARNLQRMLAEAEALARAIEAPSQERAAEWAAAAFQSRRERISSLTADDRSFEAGLEMMEGTANYVARVAVGQKTEATSARLRADREADGIRWRFYDTGAAICLLLDRFQPDWKVRIDSDIEQTTTGLLEAAIRRSGVRASTFSPTELARFESKAAAAIEELSARQRRVREELLGPGGPRLVVEVASDAEPFRVTRFDPINLLVLDGGEIAHANFITLAGSAGTIEVSNASFARGSFAGTVALTRGSGRHPLVDGVRTLTVVGLKGMPDVERRDGVLTLQGAGLRVTLRGADARTEGETIRIGLSAPR